MKASGKPLLLTASIIYIIIGALLIIFGILALILAQTVMDLIADAGFAEAIAIMPSGLIGGALFLAFLVPGIVDLIIGIIGTKKSAIASSATFFIVVGIILAAITLIFSITALGIGTIVSLVLPALFIIGGFMNKKDAA